MSIGALELAYTQSVECSVLKTYWNVEGGAVIRGMRGGGSYYREEGGGSYLSRDLKYLVQRSNLQVFVAGD